MHLFNIMKQLGVPAEHKKSVVEYFKDKNVSVSAVRILMEEMAEAANPKKSAKID